ncbi:MAG: hypothetical protein AABY99_10310 [Pseudomonadota bacterium]
MTQFMIKRSQSFKRICAQTLLLLLMVSQSAIASPSLVELPDEAIQKLKIDAGFGWGIFSGTIYNGNDNYHVAQLIVSMTPIHDHHHMDMHANMSHEPKVHQINLELPPATKGALSMPLTGDDVHVHDFKWEVIKVMGYPAH